ncbi:OsmC family protein [Arthrobacter sp. H14]|uniref:OsmC family protein n=1 Tax=Arthrobacter sp. H14 TaxID=1312959 RepID=UPI00047CB3CC|nr:OsmC family protein [Arthrobacter sp. H14]
MARSGGLEEHHYEVTVRWTGNLGEGTTGYKKYSRNHEIESPGVPKLLGSADPTFHGDENRWNPEQLLLSALTQCHMMSYFHIASAAGVVVTAYTDHAEGTLKLNRDGSGEFIAATLHPRVVVATEDQVELARTLHRDAAGACFIGRSVNFPVKHEPEITVAA